MTQTIREIIVDDSNKEEVPGVFFHVIKTPCNRNDKIQISFDGEIFTIDLSSAELESCDEAPCYHVTEKTDKFNIGLTIYDLGDIIKKHFVPGLESEAELLLYSVQFLERKFVEVPIDPNIKFEIFHNLNISFQDDSEIRFQFNGESYDFDPFDGGDHYHIDKFLTSFSRTFGDAKVDIITSTKRDHLDGETICQMMSKIDISKDNKCPEESNGSCKPFLYGVIFHK